ncbi:DUF342 domain-containing protein [Pelosinus sp. sgz500959]|uniref:DUF342 domain-containing protein n=1 Tax=Pelosinus sp. sgz500959 TaxID=3242472 RepID=UPI003672E878
MVDNQLVFKKNEQNDIVTEEYSIVLNDTGIFLTIYSSDVEKSLVSEATIVAQLKKWEITTYNREIILQAIEKADGQSVKVAEIPKPIIKTEPDVRVLVARDRMEASLEVTFPPDSRSLSMDELVEKINKIGVIFGIDLELVKKAHDYPGFSVVFAKAKKPIDGSHAYIKHHVNIENKGRPEELADGSVDFKNLNLFTMVQEGDLLAEKIPATLGMPGMDVLGNEVNAKPGKDIMVPAGKNVQVVDGKLLLAMISGQLLIANNKINVVPVIEIKEDVDVSTGNIEFIGDVIVRGSVQPGFVVKADGNVEIFGTVSGGTVEGRNVIIKMGIQGMHRGHIKAKENVVAKFIENATVYAGTDIIVSDVVLHSRISAGKKVLVEGRRGLIVGGTVMAGEVIRAKVVGTQMATITALEVGVNPMLREEYQQIRGEIKKVNISLEKTQKALSILRSMDQSTMAPDKREMLLKLTKAQFHLVGQSETMRNRMAAIEVEFDGMRDGHIKVSDSIYPGVKVVIGTLVKPISEILKFISLYGEDGEIKIGIFK